MNPGATYAPGMTDDDKPPSPGYVWRPGSSPQDNPLQLVVAIVVVSVLVGSIVLAIVT